MAGQDFTQVLQQLKVEFIEHCGDRLDTIEAQIDRMYRGVGDRGTDFSDMQREVHSLKGGAGTFGFHSITLVAHRLEDYIESAGRLTRKHFLDVQKFVDCIRKILDARRKPTSEEMDEFLQSLPSATVAAAISAPRHVTVLLVMAQGLQRKLVATELKSCGFEIVFADNALNAFGLAVSLKPDIVVSSNEFEILSGINLARALRAIPEMSGVHIVLCTASEGSLIGIPEIVHIVHKGKDFAGNLAETLMRLGVFGKVPLEQSSAYA